VGPALRILQLNVEGLSASKRVAISTLATRHNVDVVCLEETHVDTDKSSLFTLAGFDFISYRLHAKHGRATYVKSSLTDTSTELSADQCEVIKVGSHSIESIELLLLQRQLRWLGHLIRMLSNRLPRRLLYVSGVRQGCILSPFLFMIVTDYVMRRTMDKPEYGIVWQKHGPGLR